MCGEGWRLLYMNDPSVAWGVSPKNVVFCCGLVSVDRNCLIANEYSLKNMGKIEWYHYSDVIMGAIASQITSLTIVYSTFYSDADHRKHRSSASLAFVREIHRGPVNFHTNGQWRGKCFHLMKSSCQHTTNHKLGIEDILYKHKTFFFTLANSTSWKWCSCIFCIICVRVDNGSNAKIMITWLIRIAWTSLYAVWERPLNLFTRSLGGDYLISSLVTLIQLRFFITWYNIIVYCIHHRNDNGRIQVWFQTHNRPPDCLRHGPCIVGTWLKIDYAMMGFESILEWHKIQIDLYLNLYQSVELGAINYF